MPHSIRAQSSTARADDHTTVSVCMLRRIEAYMEVHRVHSGLIHDPALLQAVALGYERYDTLLALCTAGWPRARLSAARERQTRTVGRTPAVHCTVCRAVCAQVFTVHMLRVRVSTFTCMLACVTGLGSSDGAVRVQLRDHWFGPCGSYRSCPCPGLF